MKQSSQQPLHCTLKSGPLQGTQPEEQVSVPLAIMLTQDTDSTASTAPSEQALRRQQPQAQGYGRADDPWMTPRTPAPPPPEPKGVWPPQSPPFPGALRGELATAGRPLLKTCLRVMAGTPGKSLSSCRASPWGGRGSGKLPRAWFRPGVSSSGKTSPWRETHPGVLVRPGPESGQAVKESKSGGKRGVLWSDFCIVLPSNQKVLQAERRLEPSSPTPHLSSSQRTRCPGRQRVAGVPGDWRRLCFTGMRTGSSSLEPPEVPWRTGQFLGTSRPSTGCADPGTLRRSPLAPPPPAPS